MRYFIKIVFISLLFTISSCGEQQFDSRDSDSLKKMMSGMSLQEEIEFLKDIELVIHSLGAGINEQSIGDPSYKLNGYTVKEIKEEAENIRAFIKEKNIQFLREKINEMQTSGKSSIGLHQTVDGMFSLPRAGYIHKDYYLESLKAILLELSPNDKSLEVSASISDPTSNNTQPNNPVPVSDSNATLEYYEKPKQNQYIEDDKAHVKAQENNIAPESQSIINLTKSLESTSTTQRLSAAAEKAIQEGFVEITNPAVQVCTDAKIEAIRKEIGEDSPINYEMYNEAAVECGFNI